MLIFSFFSFFSFVETTNVCFNVCEMFFVGFRLTFLFVFSKLFIFISGICLYGICVNVIEVIGFT